ncbi:Npt1/Npt2 family nucleotide transporter [Candidatus Tisiphia endosymbiont of Empis tessellata]|uniref:Npt1/Npt2 family nucleotide transporter n=1 Tax=Candidatus Tisiphia endosymbiont of Empis tessellata TaxID=3066259 RepID=UPI00313EAC2E
MAVISRILSYFSITHNTFSPSKLTNKLLEYIWPVERHELSKFLYITLLMFCILFIQNIIRALKDSLVNTMIGTETVSFLKFWGVLPSSFLVMMIYVKLVNNMKGENIFYLILSIFLIFFALFAFYIFPNHTIFHLSSEHASILIKSYPNLKWFILLLSNWSFSLFYIIAELWPGVMFALLFWQFVNNVTSVEQSKRFYPLFGLLAQTGIYISGKFLENLAYLNQYLIKNFDLKHTNTELSVQIILVCVLVLGIIAVATFWMLNHKILAKDQVEQLKFSVKKQSITLVESFKMIIASRYIRLIATLLICYGIAINLVEGPWKASAAKIYKTPTEFAAFVGNYLSITGIFTILFVILGSNIVRRLGWFTAAIITPIIVFVTGMLFFAVSDFDGFAALIVVSFMLTDPSLIAITMGLINNVLSKSSKYTLFDSTKEMSYVPLDTELKTKGKAAADIIGTKLGKSTSAFLQSLIFIIMPSATFQSISIYLMVVFGIICIIWIWTVRELNKEYNDITS